MAFQRTRSKGTSVRITGLFKSRTKKGLAVGTAREEDIRALGAKMKEAITAKKGLVFFLWSNPEAEDGQPNYSLTADLAMDRDDVRGRRPTVKVVDEPENDDDIPF